MVADTRSNHAGLRFLPEREIELPDCAGGAEFAGSIHDRWSSCGGVKSGWNYQLRGSSSACGVHYFRVGDGAGPVDPAQGDGTLVGFPLPTNTAQAAVQAIAVTTGPFGGGQTITPFVVTYAGPAPYLVAGTSQINFQVVKYAGTIFASSSNGFQIYIAQ